MADVTYNEERPLVFTGETKLRGIIGFLVRRKIAKDSHRANILLVIVIIVCLVLTLIILWPKNQTANSSVPFVTPGFEA